MMWISTETAYTNIQYPSYIGNTHTFEYVSDDKVHRAKAYYICETNEIYLPVGFNYKYSIDVEVLVHELVHHMQCINGNKAMPEKEAYALAAKWFENKDQFYVKFPR